MLAEIYSWFTEGFDTADFKDAKALFQALGGYAARDMRCAKCGSDNRDLIELYPEDSSRRSTMNSPLARSIATCCWSSLAATIALTAGLTLSDGKACACGLLRKWRGACRRSDSVSALQASVMHPLWLSY
jgi:hypothetical protein